MRIGKILTPMYVILIGISCSKSSQEGVLLKDVRNRQKNSSVSSLSYGNNIFYVTGDRKNDVVSPVLKPNYPGHFTSIPSGLSINRKSGTIDLQKSEPGQPYKIFYIDKDGKLADSVRIVVSGIGYNDGIYNLQILNGDFNGNLHANYNSGEKVPQSLVNSFTVSNVPVNNVVSGKNLRVNRLTGEIRIKESKDDGFFTKNNPNQNHDVVEFRYRISDRSKRRLNNIRVNLYYYSRERDVPDELKRMVEERKMIMNRVNAMPSPGVERKNSEGTSPEDLTEETLSNFNKPVRPPLIIVVG